MGIKKKLWLALAVWSLAQGTVLADVVRPRIGLVLGGGGARGLAHVGVLKVLEEARVPVDCIVGTSMGALVAGGYAVGRTPAELEARVAVADWDELLSSSVPRQFNTYRRKQDEVRGLTRYDLGIADSGQVKVPRAALSTQKIAYFLREMTDATSIPDFNHLTIPYRAVATDLETGAMVVLGQGGLVEAMRASMAVPGVFQPVEVEGRVLVDGGLSRNLPVDVVRQLCADVVIAVDVGEGLYSRDKLRNALDIAVQYTRLMMQQNVAPQLASLNPGDVRITPDLAGFSSADFNQGPAMMARGELAARTRLPQLRHLALDQASWQRWQAERLAKKRPRSPIMGVEVDALSWINPEVLKEAVDIPLGRPLDIHELQQRLNKIYGRGDFSQLDYVLADVSAGQSITLKPVEKDWGPNYLSLGLALAGDQNRADAYEMALMYRRTWLNRLGGEWKTMAVAGRRLMLASEFYQPLQLDGYAFLAPKIIFEREPLAIWTGQRQIAEYSYRKRSVGLDLGTSQLRYGELRLGWHLNDYVAARLIGEPSLPDSRSWDSGPQLELFYDQLDSLFFPRTGSSTRLYAYVASTGSESAAQRYGGEWRTGFSMGRTGGNLTLRGQAVEGQGSDLANLRWLGGSFNLSSYPHQALLGDRFAFGRLQLYRPLGAALAGSGSHYLGTSLESGRIHGGIEENIGWHHSGALFWGYESVLGPFHLGVAYGDNRQARYFLSLGYNRF